MTELDQPIWAALTTVHRSVALANGLARRYPPEMSPLAALRVPTPEAFSDLRGLVARGERVGLFTTEPIAVPDDWEIVVDRPIEQMTCNEPPPAAAGRAPAPELLPLDERDVPEMLALAAATEPGPFAPATIRMGRYLGIRASDGRLAAMAGERLRLDGFTEISAVCTDPEFQGHGYGRALVVALTAQTLAEGNLPFLHVKHENGAKRLYERLGFSVRRSIRLTSIRRA
jgi:ribosomal protein S18 acetylase RimI-like enzyme